MATILKGAPVVAAMNERNAALCEQLKAKGINPTLAVVRVGEREDDLSYERGVMTRCGKVGVAVRQFVLPADATYIKERKLTTIIIRQNGSEVSVWPSQTIPIAIGTELPFIGENKEWYLVRLPNNDVGKISRRSVMAAQPAAQPWL